MTNFPSSGHTAKYDVHPRMKSHLWENVALPPPHRRAVLDPARRLQSDVHPRMTPTSGKRDQGGRKSSTLNLHPYMTSPDATENGWDCSSPYIADRGTPKTEVSADVETPTRLSQTSARAPMTKLHPSSELVARHRPPPVSFSSSNRSSKN